MEQFSTMTGQHGDPASDAGGIIIKLFLSRSSEFHVFRYHLAYI